MKLTKQDLLRLPKERLAEIIVEMQEEPLTITTPEKDVPHFIPFQSQHPYCWEPGGTCTNPHFDCINCPKHSTGLATMPVTVQTTYAPINGDANSTDNDEMHAYGK